MQLKLFLKFLIIRILKKLISLHFNYREYGLRMFRESNKKLKAGFCGPLEKLPRYFKNRQHQYNILAHHNPYRKLHGPDYLDIYNLRKIL